MKMEMKKESYEKPSLTVVRLEASLPIMSSEIEGGATIDPTEPGENGSVSGGYGFGTRSRGGFDNRLDNGF